MTGSIKPRIAKQARSRATESRLLQALSRLIERKDWSDITIEAIVAEADVSVGAFYKRFASKNDLLVALLDCFLRQSPEESFKKSKAAPLTVRIDVLLSATGRSLAARAHLVRAARAAKLSRAAEMNPEMVRLSRERLRRVADWLLECRSEIHHPQPREGVRIGLYLVLQSLHHALLDPPSDLDPETLIEEAKRMLTRYLTAS